MGVKPSATPEAAIAAAPAPRPNHSNPAAGIPIKPNVTTLDGGKPGSPTVAPPPAPPVAAAPPAIADASTPAARPKAVAAPVLMPVIPKPYLLQAQIPAIRPSDPVPADASRSGRQTSPTLPPAVDTAKPGVSSTRTETAQRPTRPDQPPPPAPPPPPVQPRTGIVEPPRATTPPQQQPQPAEPPAPPPVAVAPPAQPGPLRIAFETNSAVLTDDARAALDTLVAMLKSNATLRTMLKAYTSTGNSVSETRRMSLKRGMTVRLYLIEKGIQATRIDLQALGKSPDNGPGDRVDVLPGKS